jgi:N12 class adenine-specific DNA methylase
MERQAIANFDGWAAVFAKKTTDFEFSVTNQIISKERFRHFIKVPELALFITRSPITKRQRISTWINRRWTNSWLTSYPRSSRAILSCG